MLVTLNYVSILLVVILRCDAAQNYCDLCVDHVACNNTGAFQGCDGTVVNIKSRTEQILRIHNVFRNRIAGGEIAGFPSALQMGRMTWDVELAQVAVFNLYQCHMEHDNCHSTKKFPNSGQNLAMMRVSGSPLSPARFIRSSIHGWLNESREANKHNVERYQGIQIGHFTAAVNERNNRIGCAMAVWKKGDTENHLLACNYAVNNVIEKSIYRFGATASECTSGRDKVYRNLCTANEVYDYEW